MALSANTRSQISRIKQFDLDDDTNFEQIKRQLGEPKVAELRNELRQLLAMFCAVEPDNLILMPEKFASKINDPANAVTDVLDEIVAFNKKHVGFSSLLQKTKDAVSNHYETVVHFSIISAVFGGKLTSILKEIDSAKSDYDSLLEELKETAKGVVVDKKSEHFSDAAWWNNFSSLFWFLGTATSLGATLVFAWFNLTLQVPFDISDTLKTELSGENANYFLVQMTISKLIMFATLSFATFFCAKNFNANRHKHTVNKHRQLSLMTYRALVEASENSETILQHAASAIYAPQPSGYSDGGKGVDAPTAKSFVEFIQKSIDNGNH